MRRKRKSNFRFIFFVYVCVLIVACAAALIYVNSALREYEAEHPGNLLDDALEMLRNEAADGSLWSKESTPDMEAGEFETGKDIKAEFIRRINGEVTYSRRTQLNETDCRYGILSDGFEIGEVILRAVGEPKQKLAIITIQEYEILSYNPIKHDYTLSVPTFVKIGEDIKISINGNELSSERFTVDTATGSAEAVIEGIYMRPDVIIMDNYQNTLFEPTYLIHQMFF